MPVDTPRFGSRYTWPYVILALREVGTPMGLSELQRACADLFGNEPHYRGLKYTLDVMREYGLIEDINPSSKYANIWQLTAKGKKAYKENKERFDSLPRKKADSSD
jgi:DNA-binding PadR family transcriptional regulator